MDGSDAQFRLEQDGVCLYCHNAAVHRSLRPATQSEAERRLENWARLIRRKPGRVYDCVLGISGGVDSAFALHLARLLGLRALVVHLDNGWNSPAAARNIHRMVKGCGFHLITHVVDWPEFRDIQRSLIQADVLDIELVTDHAFYALLYRVARAHNIRFSLTGNNNATESFMPPGWNWNKHDLRNLRAIHAAWGTIPIRSTPVMGFWTRLLSERLGFWCRPVHLLNDWVYRQTDALRVLSDEYGYEYCGGKHYESVFTKFYQAHILPRKFGIDKRRVHYSSLICNDELTREAALEMLQREPYGAQELEMELPFVLRKLQLSEEEFEVYLRRPPVSHLRYPSDRYIYDWLSRVRRWMRNWLR